MRAPSKKKRSSKLLYNRNKYKGEEIFRTREYGMFSNAGNNYVHKGAYKFKNKNDKFHEKWRERNNVRFNKVMKYLKKSKQFQELQDTAVQENIWLAIM